VQTAFIAISSALAFCSPLVYVRAILRGEAKPHRTTRIVLLIITVLTFASLLAQHNTVAIWLAGVSVFQSVLIFILSIKYGMGGWAKTDFACLIIALIGIVLWQTTNQPVLALYAAILADFTGMVPALIKTFRYPETEIWAFYLMDVFASIFTLMALENWAIHEYSYPIYVFLINLAMVLLVVRPKKSRTS